MVIYNIEIQGYREHIGIQGYIGHRDTGIQGYIEQRDTGIQRTYRDTGLYKT